MNLETVLSAKELLKSRKTEFLSLIEIVPDAIVIIDKTGQIEYINFNATEMFGYSEDELLGKTIEILMPRRYQERHVQHREGYSKSPIKRPMGNSMELFGRRKNKEEFPVDIMLSPIVIGNKELVISVIRDITFLKEREKEAKKQSRQLEDMINALTHDLKTPLIAAETNYKLLIEEHFGKLTKEQEEIIDLLTKSNKDALRLVKNLLDVFKFETKSYKLLIEPIEILDLLHRAADAVSAMLEEKRINLKLPRLNFKFSCDFFELERVIVNLLVNSIKYTETGGTIEIDAIKNEEGKVLMSVKDNGKGMSVEEMEKLFERFWHSRRSNTSSQSTGLGLYLCKKVIEAHNGKIWVESEENKGTKVSFEVPELNQI